MELHILKSNTFTTPGQFKTNVFRYLHQISIWQFLYVASLITLGGMAVILRYSETVITQQWLAAAALTRWALMEVTASAVQFTLTFAFCTYAWNTSRRALQTFWLCVSLHDVTYLCVLRNALASYIRTFTTSVSSIPGLSISPWDEALNQFSQACTLLTF